MEELFEEFFEEIPEPIGAFILKQKHIIGTMGSDGMYYHYSQVCELLSLMEKNPDWRNKKIPQINIDDRIKCINIDRSPKQYPEQSAETGLVLDRDYIVYGLKREKCCGNLVVDIGRKLNGENTCGKTYTCICGKIHTSKDGISWKSASRFIKVKN